MFRWAVKITGCGSHAHLISTVCIFFPDIYASSAVSTALQKTWWRLQVACRCSPAWWAHTSAIGGHPSRPRLSVRGHVGVTDSYKNNFGGRIPASTKSLCFKDWICLSLYRWNANRRSQIGKRTAFSCHLIVRYIFYLFLVGYSLIWLMDIVLLCCCF